MLEMEHSRNHLRASKEKPIELTVFCESCFPLRAENFYHVTTSSVNSWLVSWFSCSLVFHWGISLFLLHFLLFPSSLRLYKPHLFCNVAARNYSEIIEQFQIHIINTSIILAFILSLPDEERLIFLLLISSELEFPTFLLPCAASYAKFYHEEAKFTSWVLYFKSVFLEDFSIYPEMRISCDTSKAMSLEYELYALIYIKAKSRNSFCVLCNSFIKLYLHAYGCTGLKVIATDTHWYSQIRRCEEN